jgi:FKBP-type peptidyl-prolyl cis-trans isomerase
MRAALALVVPLALLVAACGDDSSSDGTSGSDTTVDSSIDPSLDSSLDGTATTTPLAKPNVSLPTTTPTSLVVTDLRPGSGSAAAVGDTVVVHYVGVRSADGTEFDNSYDRGQPFEVVLGAGEVIKGWEDGLVGAQAGGQRQLDIPSDLAYGANGAGDIIQPGDAITFVVDVLAVLATSTEADQPAITLEPASNIESTESIDLIEGTGPTPVEGNRFATYIMLFRADTGELVNSSWGTPPIVFDYGSTSTAFPGILEVAQGMKVGGRRQSQVPYALMFEGKGNEQIGLPAAIDVVIVMDLVAVY